MTTLLSTLAAYRPFSVLLVGDFMLDEHLYGAAERLSPDAPVPVLHATRSEHQPGGAANVALCLRALEARVTCIGVTGDDPSAEALRTALRQHHCDVTGLLVDPSRPTTVKRSIIGLAQHRHPQKMFRVDVESREPVSPELIDQMLSALRTRLSGVDVVCIEDYNKGVCCERLCSELITMCRDAGKPVVVDPAAIADYEKYAGATVITPNRSEAELALGLEAPMEPEQIMASDMAENFRASLKLDALILTLDRHGALLQVEDQPPQMIPTQARSVYDVSGAGDVVIAAVAGAVANKLDWPDIVRFANAAAGLEVEQFGVQPIAFAAVRRELLSQARQLNGKVRTLDDLLVEVDAHREAGRTIVLTNGCFDVIHAGHVAYLQEATQLGDVLIVGVNSDAQVCEQKGKGRPIFCSDHRLAVLQALEPIAYLVEFDEPTAANLIASIRPDVYVKGGDYAPEEINEWNDLKRLGISVRVLAYQDGLSSTALVDRIRGTVTDQGEPSGLPPDIQVVPLEAERAAHSRPA